MNQRGSSLIFILIVVVLTSLIAGSAFYLGNRTASNTKTPTPSSSPIPDSTPTQSVSPQASPASSMENLMKITRVYQAACSSPSCTSTTTLVIDGLNLNLVSIVNVTGQNDHQDYGGILGNVSANGQEIIVDFLNLPCQAYSGTASNPLSASSSVKFSFTPATCK